MWLVWGHIYVNIFSTEYFIIILSESYFYRLSYSYRYYNHTVPATITLHGVYYKIHLNQIYNIVPTACLEQSTFFVIKLLGWERKGLTNRDYLYNQYKVVWFFHPLFFLCLILKFFYCFVFAAGIFTIHLSMPTLITNVFSINVFRYTAVHLTHPRKSPVPLPLLQVLLQEIGLSIN